MKAIKTEDPEIIQLDFDFEQEQNLTKPDIQEKKTVLQEPKKPKEQESYVFYIPPDCR